MKPKSQQKIDLLRQQATSITGIPEILEKEYSRVNWIKHGKNRKPMVTGKFELKGKKL